MRMEHEPVEGRSRDKKSLLPLASVVLIAFVAGIAAMGWLLTRSDRAAEWVGVRSAPPAVQVVQPAAAPTPEPTPVAGEPQRLVIDPEITRRVNRIEQRIGEIEQQSRSAVGNADRAEGLLVAFAARRALDRGVPLGYIEGLLRQRFGDTQRQAVATVITASRNPVTLEELQQGLQEIGAVLKGGGPNQDWWSALKAEMGGLIAIRKEGTPSTMPGERLRRAQRRLDAGQVDVALAEVLRMPGRDNASEWISEARNYVAARRALDTLETAALLDPRNPPRIAGQIPPALRRTN